MDYYFSSDNFIIKAYDTKKIFSDFLPSVAGVNGTPIWAYFVNRGQGIASFGVRDKASAILEFSPKSIAEQRVNAIGFRTFLMIGGEIVEPFGTANRCFDRTMSTAAHGFSITEQNTTENYALTVDYAGLPEEPVAALMRRVTLQNTGAEREFAIVDGLAEILPYGMTNANQKEAGNLFRSWMRVEENDSCVPKFCMSASTADSEAVEEISGAGFYFAAADGKLLQTIVDPDVIFDYDRTLSFARGLEKKTYDEIRTAEQVCCNKLPCAFVVTKRTLAAGESLTFAAYAGASADNNAIRRLADRARMTGFAKEKFIRAKTLVDAISDPAAVHTAWPLFDAYMRQSFLDNTLRSGAPVKIDGEGRIHYLYSRKHGDLEREYNAFVVEPEYYSSGNGNFRDVIQNRRNDVFFYPFTGDYNIKYFASLLQADGYNPLHINGTRYALTEAALDAVLEKFFPDQKTVFSKFLREGFRFGALVQKIAHHVDLPFAEIDRTARAVLAFCTEEACADFGEGYWVDHFEYLLDLIESYVFVYPDKAYALLFGDASHSYYPSSVRILPRREKQILQKNGTVRRYGAIQKRENPACPARVTLFSKLLGLACAKLAALDYDNLGLDMEAGKPGWNDAMNGLPAVFGSSVADAAELKRLVDYMLAAAKSFGADTAVLGCQAELMAALLAVLGEALDGASYYFAANDAKERFWQRLERGDFGELSPITAADAVRFLEGAAKKLARGLDKAKKIGGGVLPTYFFYEAVGFAVADETKKTVDITEFKRRGLPSGLEGAAKSFKTDGDHAKTYRAVRGSALYDKTLGVYKVSESLEAERLEIGRIRSFVPGWLERESCFLHLDYKYLYGILRGRLYKEFFEELKTNFVCFHDPARYGRNPLQNSSFLATAVHPDKKLIGQGFQPRLSGCNAEVLSIGRELFFGREVFHWDGQRLSARFAPILPGEMFDGDNTVTATFLGTTAVTYHNPARLCTYLDGVGAVRVEVFGKGLQKTVEGDTLWGQDAMDLRDGKFERLVITIAKREEIYG